MLHDFTMFTVCWHKQKAWLPKIVIVIAIAIAIEILNDDSYSNTVTQ